jgi:hypothetical protein
VRKFSSPDLSNIILVIFVEILFLFLTTFSVAYLCSSSKLLFGCIARNHILFVPSELLDRPPKSLEHVLVPLAKSLIG